MAERANPNLPLKEKWIMTEKDEKARQENATFKLIQNTNQPCMNLECCLILIRRAVVLSLIDQNSITNPQPSWITGHIMTDLENGSPIEMHVGTAIVPLVRPCNRVTG